MKRLCALVLTVLIAGCAPTSQTADLRQIAVSPESMQQVSDDYGYSQTVQVGSTIWVSGQAGFGPDGIPASVEAQSRLAFQNLQLVLEAAGSSLDDIVELTTYHVSMDELPAFASVKAEFIQAPYPAWTAVEVSGLAEPELRVEIRATAVAGSGSRLP